MDWFESLTGPRYALAPMVGQCDLPFRILTRQHGCNVVYTQMIEAARFLNDETYRHQVFDSRRGDGNSSTDRPLVVQIAGCDPNVMIACSKLLENHCDAIDINLGCPQQRAIDNNYGSALLVPKHWETVATIVRELSQICNVPIWCKIRCIPGENKDHNLTVAFAQLMEKSGVSLIALHARYPSTSRRRNGAAFLEAVKAVKTAVSIPVLTNGNVVEYSDLVKNLELTGADGIMVGEALLRNPWLFSGKEANATLVIQEYLTICMGVDPSAFSIVAARQHVRNILRPDKRSGNQKFRDALGMVETANEILSVLLQYGFLDVKASSIPELE
ncbi:dihydrouridine synthase-domain-containing protein [Chytriomyces sp. MP71]|nr:dihydrouridine synthase-domain-containing protein [Chytriomyces sp. MP71]